MAEKVGKHKLIERLTERAMMESVLCSTNRSNGEKHRPLRGRDLPGKVIEGLSAEEREALKSAKGEDFGWRGFK